MTPTLHHWSQDPDGWRYCRCGATSKRGHEFQTGAVPCQAEFDKAFRAPTPPPVPWSIVEEEVEGDLAREVAAVRGLPIAGPHSDGSYTYADSVHPRAPDPVNKPEHYIVGNTECADVIASLGLSFFAGSAFKYIWRHGRKDPTKKVEDLRKAVAMLNREIARLEKP